MKKLLTILLTLILYVSIQAQDTVYVYQENGMIRIDDLYEDPMFLTPGQVSYRLRSSDFVLKDGLTNKEYNVGTFSEIFNSDTIGFDTQEEVIDYLTMILNRAISDVNIQDQTTQPLDFFFLQGQGPPTTLIEPTLINDTSIVVASTVLFSAGDYLGIFSGESGESRFYFGEIVSIDVDTIYLDTPLDFAFDSSDNVISTTREMNVDGLSNKQIFAVRGAAVGTVLTIDITRILLQITTTDPPAFDDFGDITNGLINGIVLRRNDGYTSNIFNAKTNGELANLMYDLQFYDQTGPQGVNGVAGRMTFAGQDKHGVAIRLEAGDTLEMIIQDDLTSLISFRIVAQGHIVED